MITSQYFPSIRLAAERGAQVVFVCNKLGITCNRIAILPRGNSSFELYHDVEINPGRLLLAWCFIDSIADLDCPVCDEYAETLPEVWTFEGRDVKTLLKSWFDAEYNDWQILCYAAWFEQIMNDVRPQISGVDRIDPVALLRALGKEYCRRD